MKELAFSLQQFLTPAEKQATGDRLLDLKILGYIARRENVLAVRYELLGSLAEVAIPAPSDVPARKRELWEETCFEFFLGVEKRNRYWEFNLSPAGHWNVYRFDAYRQGMQEELAFVSFPFIVKKRSDCLSLELEFDLTPIVSVDRTLEIGISAVIQFGNGKITYWALTHTGLQADFHHRDSFTLRL